MITRIKLMPAAVFAAAFAAVAVPAPAWGDVAARRTPVVSAVEKAGPAVVNVNTEEEIRYQNPFGNSQDRFFQEFFGQFVPPEGRKRSSLGSGIVINPQGYILTNEHVVHRASKISVTMIDNREYPAELIGADPRSDLAVIKIDAKKPLPFVPMGSSTGIMIGETVIAIGNPFGLQHTVTTGIVSALHRDIRISEDKVYNDFIQLDASINPGNSGGPLLNIDGELIGINTAIFSTGEGIGFAIPIDNAKRVVDDLIRFGEVHRAWTGVFVRTITRKIREYFRYDGKEGVFVTVVFNGSPAARAGLKQGDIITKVGNKTVTSAEDFIRLIYSYTAGDEITVEYWRGGSAEKLSLTAEEVSEKNAVEIAQVWLGIGIAPVNDQTGQKFGLASDSGVVITDVYPKGPMGLIGVRPGDVILKMGRYNVESAGDFRKAVVNLQGQPALVFLVQRGRNGYYITVEP